MRKEIIIILSFAAYITLFYWATVVIVQKLVLKDLPPDAGLFDGLSIGMYYAIFGLSVYLVLMNLTTIIALLIAKKKKDKVATSTFRFLTIATLSLTAIFYIIYYFNL